MNLAPIPKPCQDWVFLRRFFALMTEILMKHVFCALWMALIAPLSMANAAPLDASDARFQEVVDLAIGSGDGGAAIPRRHGT